MTLKAIRTPWLVAWLLPCGFVYAHGDVTCKTPKAEWRPSVELQRELKKRGWTVRKIQVDNGCYEVYGFDENDQRVEAWFDPKSFARVG